MEIRPRGLRCRCLAAAGSALGINLREVRVVGDEETAIVDALNALRHRYTYVFTIGGIGLPQERMHEPIHHGRGYVRIAGALANLGYKVCDQTVGNVLRNHQGKGNILLFPQNTDVRRAGPVRCRERLGGLLRYYHQAAA